MMLDGYIDVHSHILPGVDDGSGSMKHTIEMLKLANQEGIKSIIATPHYACGANNKTVEELQNIREQVQIEALKIDKNFQIFLGNELYYSDSIIEDLKVKKAMTLAESNYALVEFSIRASYDTIYNGIKSLILAGYAPILAHVERYQCLKKEEDLIMELIELGAYIQMNSNSLQGSFMDKEASYNRKLFSRGLIHFIGSDCHDAKYRTPKMESTVKILSKKIDKQLLNRVFQDNPQKILNKKYI